MSFHTPAAAGAAMGASASPYRPDGEPPLKYRQPDIEYYESRHVGDDNTEIVDYVKDTHLRIWYNCQNEGYAPHYHNAIEIIYCIENGYTVTAGQQTYNLSEGDILFIPPHMMHRLLGGVSGARFIMLFDPEPLTVFRDYKIVSPLFAQAIHLSRKEDPELHHYVSSALQQAVDVYFAAQPMWEMNVYARFLRAYSAFGKNFFTKTDLGTSQGDSHSQLTFTKFADLLAYVDEHYAEPLTLEQAAEYVGFSKFHFTRLFKEYTGVTFYDHLLNRRIQAAQELLGTDRPVTDISYMTGFHSLASFSRSFKQITGFSPSEYRRYAEQYDNRRYSKSIIKLPISNVP